MSRQFPHVALLIETSREYARGLLRGVAQFHQVHGPWSIYFEPHGLRDPVPSWLKTWRGDGILVRIENRRIADAVLATGIPTVDVRGALPDVGVPFVGVDNQPVAKMAFDHLHACGLTHFGFCGTPRGENPNQDIRCDYFAQFVKEAGFDCDICLGESRRRRQANWEAEQQTIADWLRGLPKPVGVMTCHDDRGQQVLDACRRASLHVPDDVAVISVDNDLHLCNLCTPPLSSIDVNPGRIGYEAAALLSRGMNGESLPSQPILLGPPRGIAARQSTDTAYIEDQDVAAAVRYIRERAVAGLRVSDIVAETKGSPTTLERRFKKRVGRTIKAEIDRVRMDRAKLLLAETELPVSQVAVRCGYSEAKHFCEAFRKHEATTAMMYRAKFRLDQD